MDLNPDSRNSNFTFILEVWRPSPCVDDTECYSLVNDFISTSLRVTNENSVAVVTPSPAKYLQFQVDAGCTWILCGES